MQPPKVSISPRAWLLYLIIAVGIVSLAIARNAVLNKEHKNKEFNISTSKNEI